MNKCAAQMLLAYSFFPPSLILRSANSCGPCRVEKPVQWKSEKTVDVGHLCLRLLGEDGSFVCENLIFMHVPSVHAIN